MGICLRGGGGEERGGKPKRGLLDQPSPAQPVARCRLFAFPCPLALPAVRGRPRSQPSPHSQLQKVAESPASRHEGNLAPPAAFLRSFCLPDAGAGLCDLSPGCVTRSSTSAGDYAPPEVCAERLMGVVVPPSFPGFKPGRSAIGQGKGAGGGEKGGSGCIRASGRGGRWLVSWVSGLAALHLCTT